MNHQPNTPASINEAVAQESPELLLGWKRYEKARKLSPFQWNRLHIRNLAGENFDAMIDSLPEPTTPVPTPSKALSPATVAQPVELRGVAETLENQDGCWRSCSGCHELNEGHDTGPYSAVLKCHLGSGCSECGGIGAIWDTTDYADMADHMAESIKTAVQPCASQGCGGAVRQALKQIIEADDAQALTQQLIDIGRAALSADKSGGA